MEYSYKFRIYPNKIQENLIQRTFGCCRFVFNHYLARRKELYEQNGKTMNYCDCAGDMTQLKKELEWLKEVDATALQSSLRDLDAAYQNFFRRVKQGQNPGYPRFKSKRDRRKSYKSKCVGADMPEDGLPYRGHHGDIARPDSKTRAKQKLKGYTPYAEKRVQRWCG